MTAPLVYTIPEVAELLAIGRGAAYQAAACGQIPTVRIGRSLRVPRWALEELLSSPAAGSRSPQTNGADGKAGAVKGGHHRARAHRTP